MKQPVPRETDRPICPVSGCGGTVRPGKLMCLDCWRLVPVALQSAVYSAWRRVRRGRGSAAHRALRRNLSGAVDNAISAVDAYRAARANAIQAVEERR